MSQILLRSESTSRWLQSARSVTSTGSYITWPSISQLKLKFVVFAASLHVFNSENG